MSREENMTPAGITIRPIEDEDLDGVAALWRQVFPDAPSWNRPEDDIWRKLAVQRELFLVAEADDEPERDRPIVGTAMAGYDGHRGWVYYVAVAPDRQRQGIGTALMRRVELGLAWMGCHKLNLQVRATNTAVVAFYQGLGYSVEERVSMGKRLPLVTDDETGDMLYDR
jgi:ribosomal protein S18 acetylase RimI-like enzyme